MSSFNNMLNKDMHKESPIVRISSLIIDIIIIGKTKLL